MNFIPSRGYYFLFLLVNILEDGIMIKQDYLVRMIQEIMEENRNFFIVVYLQPFNFTGART